LNDTYYTTEGKYDRVPVQYQNLDAATLALTNNTVKYFQAAPYQSAQLRGQYIYGRYYDISGEEPLYLETEVGTSTAISNLATAEYQITAAASAQNAVGDFIWAGSWSGASAPRTIQTSTQSAIAISNALYDDGLFLHVDHPVVLDGVGNTGLTFANVSAVSTMTKTATLRADVANGKKQTPFLWLSAPGRTVKTSFGPNDQFMLGGRSCGSYLFMNPINKDSLLVDGDNKFGRKRISGASDKMSAIAIDITFQYRMTDYYGTGSTGTGKVGGRVSSTLTNLTYSKKIGIDIFDADDEQFSFDLEVFAKYKPEGKSIQSTATSNTTFIFNNNSYNTAVTSE
jgi:hypothetical protein